MGLSISLLLVFSTKMTICQEAIFNNIDKSIKIASYGQ